MLLANLIKQQAPSINQSEDNGHRSLGSGNKNPINQSPASSQSKDGGGLPATQPNDGVSNENSTRGFVSTTLDSHGHREKWIFLMAKSGKLKLHQINAKVHCGDTFAEELREGYRRLRGWWRFRFGFDVFSHCDFVKFEKFIEEKYANRGMGVPDSDPHIKEYYFQPRPGDTLFADPPISPEHFKHIFYDCTGYETSDGSGSAQNISKQEQSANIFRTCITKARALFERRRRVRFPPKTVAKIPQRLSYFYEKGDNEEYLWGLLAREERCALRVCLWALATFTPSIIFCFIYLFGFGGMNADLQNATTFFVLSLTLFSTFISLLLKDGNAGKTRA